MKSIITTLLVLSASFLQAQQLGTPKMVVMQPTATTISSKVAFLANATFVGGKEVSANNSNFKVIFSGTVFDEGKNFSVADAGFIAPSDGYYHFDVRVSWLRFTAPGSVTINLSTDEFSMRATSVQDVSTTNAVFDTNYGTLIKLTAGQKIYVYLRQSTNAFQHFQQVQLSGFKVN